MGAVEPVTANSGLTEFFIGIIVIPLVGNIAEHLVAVQVALKNKMELSLAVSVGSSLQVALFVAPVLVFITLLLTGQPLLLVFNSFELIALFATVIDNGLCRAGWRIQLAGRGDAAGGLYHCGDCLFLPAIGWRDCATSVDEVKDENRYSR